MKRLLILVLLSLYLFNLSGYFLYYKYFIYHTDRQAVQQIDNRLYDESELMEIKILLNLPYLTSQGQYERVDGNLEHEGIYYNYVERKVNNDTLYLKCRRNTTKTDLHQRLNDYTRKVNDIPTSEKTGNTTIKKFSLACEYVQYIASYDFDQDNNTSSEYTIVSFRTLPTLFIADPFKPPRLV
ncbi:MAG: hypothetical protein JNK79_01395 [Chitinophagaceae bacterium]|nr:hypothetical protein [Chitinophagaceae bacterium]